MKFKKSIIMLVLTIFIFGVACVSASDMDDMVMASEDDSAIELSQADINEMVSVEENEIISQIESDEIISEKSVGTFLELQVNISTAASGSTLTLTNNYECEDGFDPEGIIINESITIDGNGFIIDAQGKSRIFKVTADNVTLKNINFINGNSIMGGSVYFDKSGTVENCNFINNTATENGGAIFATNNTIILNSVFDNNNANKSGGAVYVHDAFSNSIIDSEFINNSAKNGGAIYFNGETNNLTISGNFKGNDAERAGGAIFVRGQSRNNNFSAEFYDNRAGQASGGAIFFYNLAENNVFESIFTTNYALYGGGMFFYKKANSNKFSSDFTNNTAESCGGAIFFYNTTDKNNFTGSFINNSALGNVDATVGNGGAITFKNISTNSIFTCDFINNTASLNGGGVNYRETPHNITFNANFINNTSPRGGGVNFFKSFENVIFNGEFIANSAVSGGAIAAGEGIIEDVSFKNNHAVTGGAVFFRINGSVTNCNFTGNNALGTGGAIFAVNNINILNSVFDNNSAGKSGGAVYINNTFSNSKISSVFINNSANNGGAIYFNGKINNITINGSFKGNNAERSGGAIFVRGQSVNNDFSSEFYDNHAGQASGGAIFFYNLAENNVFESIFTSNYALYGGGIFFYKKANNNNFGSNFTSNVAKSCGGAIFFYNTTDKNNFTGTFINNSALGEVSETVGNGGAITFKNISTNSIFTCDFINNTAALNGGGVNYRETPQNITFNGNFINNTSPRGGGVNFFESFENVIFNGEFTANSAINGGAIAAVEGIIKDVSFKDNHAENAGAIYFVKSGYIINCNFTNNSATGVYGSGGAIRMVLGNVTNCNFTNNKGTGDGGSAGGAISMRSGNVTNCNFTGNSAQFGGAIESYGFANVIDCNFIGNNATEDGGAIYFTANANIINCNFNGNKADMGSAIYFWHEKESANMTISNSTFLNNRANVDHKIPFYVTINENSIEIIFIGNDVLFNAIYSRKNAEISITNVTYWGVNGIENTGASTIVPPLSENEAGQNITVTGVINGNAINTVKVTDADGKIILENVSGDYYIHVRHELDSYYTEAETIVTNMKFYANVTSLTTNNRTVNLTAKSNIPNEVVGGELLFILPDGTEINATYGDNGTWWAEYTFDEYGEYNVSASHSKLDNLTVSNGTINITKADSIIILDDIVLNYGESINVTIETEGATAITAKIDENDVDVIDNFTIPVYDLNVGNYTLTVTTIADGDHNSVNKTVQITVNRAPTEIILTNETLDLIECYNSSISADLIPADAGNVTFTSSNSSVVTVDEEGNVNAVGVGSATITVSFAGNDNYAAAENKTVAVTVNEDIVISAPDVSKYYNGAERFVVIVTDSKNNPLANRSVVIGVNDVNYTRTTNDNGTASIAISLVSGQYNVTAAVGNNTVYSTITVLPTVNATDLVKVFRNGTQFYATFKDSQGNYLPDGTMVRFNINGVMYDRKVSGDEGLAKLNINLGSGHYIITSMNPITGENSANNVTVISRLVENNDLVKYYRNDSQYTVKVIGDDGNAVGAGETVIFNINGVFYSRTTNESGIAKLNINLPPGDYVITAEYKNCRVSNNIKVLPILSASDLTKQYGTSDQFVATLLDGQGKPYVEQRVQFNVNGVLYNRVTDSSGQAKLSINLPIGQYIITSSYNGSNIANNIVITA